MTVVFAALWLVLSSAFFRDLRVERSEDFLTKTIGQSVVIDGDVYLSFAPELAVVATDLRLPVEGNEALDLAALDLVKFPLPIGLVLQKWIILPEIEARGLVVNLIREEDGQTSWVQRRSSEVAAEPQSRQTDVIAFLGERNIAFSDMSVRAENKGTGFEFDFQLDAFSVTQSAPATNALTEVQSSGSMNGQPFHFDGVFPTGAPFTAEGNFGDLTVDLDGQKPADGQPGDFDGELAFETEDTQQLLALLRLKGQFDASAEGTLQLVRRDGRLDTEDIDVRTNRAEGQTARLTGRFGDARFGPDFDLTLNVDFVGTNAPLQEAIFVKDIRPQEAEMRIISVEDGIEIDSFFLRTNAFDDGFRDVGPFRVGRIQRSEDGDLQLKDVTFSVGPPQRPYVLAQASVENLLTLQGYDLTGSLDLPAQRILLTLPEEEALPFGRLIGALHLRETNGEPDLQKFHLSAADTDLWAAEIDVTASDLDDLDGLELRAAISTSDGKAFLDALDLEPIDIGEMGSDLTVARQGDEILLDAYTFGGETAFHTDMSFRILDASPVIRGAVRSDGVRIVDARNKFLALQQLTRVRSLYRDAKEGRDSETEDDFQPLVLPETEALQPDEEDLSDFQPLVLPEAVAASTTDENAHDVQPLVISDDVGDLAIDDLLDVETIGRRLDAEVTIDIKKIIGLEGVSNVESQISVKDGMALLGPLNLVFGTGQVDVSASMDVIDTPDKLRLEGRAGGWDFGQVLDAFGTNPGGYGTISGRFDVTGQRSSVRDFLSSMAGSATVDMSNGRLSNTLIELAGLGVLPWLFSQERRQGFAEVVCLKAPLRVQNGRIELNDSVLETRRVQLVGAGVIDLSKETIALTAEPRPIGRPLARSAWPIEVTGNLRSPDIKVAERKTRRARVPLSMPETRTPCVPDVAQLQQTSESDSRAGPR